jgi:thioredoxin reductase (NADPH)
MKAKIKSVVFVFTGAIFLLLGFYKTGFVSCSPSLSFDLNKLKGLNNIVPVVIIGSGPAGLTAAIYSSRLGYPTYLISGLMPGGQLTQTSYIENWPGEKRILGQTLMDNMHYHSKDLGVTFISEKVEKIDLGSWPFKINIGDEFTLNALAIIISTGATPRTLNIPGEKEYFGKGVTTCAVCDAPFYKDKDVIVIGGGDSAAEQALQLSSYVKHVEILVRKDKMRASKAMQNNISKLDNVSVSYNKDLREIIGDGTHVTGVKIYDNKNDKTSSEPISGVFLAIGHLPNTQLVKGQLNTDSQGYITLKERSQKTSVPGVFAAGDVEDHTYRQAIVASGSGSKAALDADMFLQHIGVNTEFVAKLKNRLFFPESMASLKIEQIKTVSEFEDVLKKNDLVVFDFYGNQCPPCKAMMPVFESVAKKLQSKAVFVKVNTDVSSELVEKLRIVKVPCFLIYEKQELVARKYGILDKKDFVKWVESHATH